MIPLSVMVTGRGTVSFKIKGSYGRKSPSKFTSTLKPLIFWNITYKCNLKCIHCYISASPQGRPGELSLEEALRVADEIVDLGSPMVILSGGEPLVRSDFWDIAGRLVNGGVKIALSTNGTLLTKDVVDKLLKLNVSYVGISLDSVNPNFHDMFRGVQGAFKMTINGVKNSLEAGLPVGFRMTLTKYNIGEAGALVELARKLGVPRISFYLIDLTGRAREELELLPSREQLETFLNNMILESKRIEGDMEILVVRGNFTGIYVANKLATSREEFLEYMSMISAQGDCGRKTISIYPDGKVKPCQFIDWIDIGDVKKERLKDIISLSNEKLRTFAKIYENLRGPKCSRCPFKIICGGGSRGRALAITGDEWGDDPLCPIDPEEIARKWRVTEDDIRDIIGI